MANLGALVSHYAMLGRNHALAPMCRGAQLTRRFGSPDLFCERVCKCGSIDFGVKDVVRCTTYQIFILHT